MSVERIGQGVYRVTVDGHGALVYVAGPPGGRWAFFDGRVYREAAATGAAAISSTQRAGGPQALSAPMPATVLKVLASPGATVTKGDTLVVLEAMKMELPLRAPSDATVAAVYCREGQLVTPDTILVELE